MREVLEALNQIVADGIIVGYAIGGAVGASFYIKAVQTEDIDAFVFLPPPVSGLVLIAPVYEALVELGGVVEREHIRFGSWPLQILTDANDLIAEAIKMAQGLEYEGVPTGVFRAEHLCAIALQTGRSKDYFRLMMFLEQGAVDEALLIAVLERFGLMEKWEKWRDANR